MANCSVRNANYESVLTALNNFFHDNRYRICKCQRCLNDIIALALNYLPPHYYVETGRGGEIGSPLIMVENAVIEAMDRVSKNPRH